MWQTLHLFPVKHQLQESEMTGHPPKPRSLSLSLWHMCPTPEQDSVATEEADLTHEGQTVMLFYVRPKVEADVFLCLLSPSFSPQGQKGGDYKRKTKNFSNSLSGQAPTRAGRLLGVVEQSITAKKKKKLSYSNVKLTQDGIRLRVHTSAQQTQAALKATDQCLASFELFDFPKLLHKFWDLFFCLYEHC